MRTLIIAMLLFSAVTATARTISPFELPWMNNAEEGTTYKSTDHNDGVFVLEPYFYDCPYCHQNAPNVEKLAEEYATQACVQVLDVGIDLDDMDYEAWISKHEPNHPVLKDAQRKLVKQLGTTGYPSTYVVDCKGNVVYSSKGVWSATVKQKIREHVNKLLTQSCTR